MNARVRTLALMLVMAAAPLQAQPPQAPTSRGQAPQAPAVNDFKPSSTNQPGSEYPQVNSEGRVRVRVVAPDAQAVLLDIGAVRYPLTKRRGRRLDRRLGAPGRGLPLLPGLDRQREGAGSREPLLLRREPVGQRRGSACERPGLLRAQERPARAGSPGDLPLHRQRQHAAVLRLHAARLREGHDNALSRAVPAARRWRGRDRLVLAGQGQPDHGQPHRRGQGQAVHHRDGQRHVGDARDRGVRPHLQQGPRPGSGRPTGRPLVGPTSSGTPC